MPTFFYQAKKLDGEEIEGQREAADRFELAESLRKEGYYLVFSRAEKKAGPRFKLLSFLGRVSLEEKMIFARNLSVMAGAGVSIAKAFDILSRQTDNRSWKKILENLGQEIKKGVMLNQALGNHPQIFSPLFRSMVKAGEASGKIEEALKLIAQQLESDYGIKRKIRGAFVYPAVIISAMFLIGALMFIFVVPTMLATFEELNVALPAATLILVKISRFLIDRTFLAAGILAAFVLSVVFLIRLDPVKKITAKLFLSAPAISGIVRKMNAARTCRTLSSLISAGVDIVESIKITEEVIQNPSYKKVLAEAAKEIQKGNPISEVFIAYSNVYPLLVGEMIAVGEETGKLSDMLMRVAGFFEDEVSESVKSLSTVIEPVLMIIVGIVVGFFAVSMIQPLYSAVGNL